MRSSILPGRQRRRIELPDEGIERGIGAVGPLLHRRLGGLGSHRIVERVAQPVGHRAVVQDAGGIVSSA